MDSSIFLRSFAAIGVTSLSPSHSTFGFLFLAWKIHDFRSTKGLAMVQIRCLSRFETKSEAFACPNIPQQTVFFFQIFSIDRWLRSLTNGRAVPMVERFC